MLQSPHSARRGVVGLPPCPQGTGGFWDSCSMYFFPHLSKLCPSPPKTTNCFQVRAPNLTGWFIFVCALFFGISSTFNVRNVKNTPAEQNQRNVFLLFESLLTFRIAELLYLKLLYWSASIKIYFGASDHACYYFHVPSFQK